MTFRNSGAPSLCLAVDVNTVLHTRLRIRLLCKAQVVIACRAYKLGKRRWSYNQCELVLHQDGASGPGNVLTAVGAVYKKESDLEELCPDPEGQVCEVDNIATLPITQLMLGMLAVVVHAGCRYLQSIHITQPTHDARKAFDSCMPIRA